MKYHRLDNGKKSKGIAGLCYFAEPLKDEQVAPENIATYHYKRLKENDQLYLVVNDEPYPIRDVLAGQYFLAISDAVLSNLPLEKFNRIHFEPVKLCEYIDDERIKEIPTQVKYYALYDKGEEIKVMDDQKSDFFSLGSEDAPRMIYKWVMDAALDLDEWLYSTLFSGFIVSEEFLSFLDSNKYKGIGVKSWKSD